MKKLVVIASLIAVSLIAVGCGNSPDGDKQRVSYDHVLPN